jgi:hypothetical protein
VEAAVEVKAAVGKNLLESVLLVLERAAYKSGLQLSLPPYEILGSDALFTCDICLYIPVDSTLLHSSVALECKLSSSLTLQISTAAVEVLRLLSRCQGRRRGVEAAVEV